MLSHGVARLRDASDLCGIMILPPTLLFVHIAYLVSDWPGSLMIQAKPK
jgi:hypothetical protein